MGTYDYETPEDQPARYGDAGDYCPHGTYVGGCGIDWMCQWCEDGISLAEAVAIESGRRTRLVRERASAQAQMIARLLMHGVPSADVLAIVAYDNRTMGNPPNRYGRV